VHAKTQVIAEYYVGYVCNLYINNYSVCLSCLNFFMLMCYYDTAHSLCYFVYVYAIVTVSVL